MVAAADNAFLARQRLLQAIAVKIHKNPELCRNCATACSATGPFRSRLQSSCGDAAGTRSAT